MAESKTTGVRESKTLRITNTTMADIILTVGCHQIKDGQVVKGPAEYRIPTMNIGGAVTIEGEHAEMLMNDPYFNSLTDNKTLIVNREAKMGENKRAASEPEAPADLVEKTTPGNEVQNVGGIGVKVDSFQVTHA